MQRGQKNGVDRWSNFLSREGTIIASNFHISTFPRIRVSSTFGHNIYNIILYIIFIILWGFYQPTQMRGNVEM